MTPSEPENTCEGYCELWIEGKRIFKVNQGRNQRANAYSSVSIQKGAKIRRTSQKVLAIFKEIVVGNSIRGANIFIILI